VTKPNRALEQRLRRRARRTGATVQKSRLENRYWILDVNSRIVSPERGLSLDELATFLEDARGK
jgi:hypothetical protein